MVGEQPAMFAIVAVGAIAIQLLLRMPYFLTASRTGAQSRILCARKWNCFATPLFEKVECIYWENVAIPFGALEGLICTTFARELCRARIV